MPPPQTSTDLPGTASGTPERKTVTFKGTANRRRAATLRPTRGPSLGLLIRSGALVAAVPIRPSRAKSRHPYPASFRARRDDCGAPNLKRVGYSGVYHSETTRFFGIFRYLAESDTQKGMSIWTVLEGLRSSRWVSCSQTRRPG